MYFTHIVFGRFNDVSVKLKFLHSSTFAIYPGVDELFLLFAEFLHLQKTNHFHNFEDFPRYQFKR